MPQPNLIAGSTLIKCPHCSGKVSMSDGKIPAIFHTIPQCDEFAKVETMNEATLFMRNARHEVYGREPDEALS